MMKCCNTFYNGIATVILWNRKNYEFEWIFILWITVAISGIRSCNFTVHVQYYSCTLTTWLCDDEHLWFVEPSETVSFFSSIQRVRLHQTTARKVFDVHKWYDGGGGGGGKSVCETIVHCLTSTTMITIQFAFVPRNMITFGMKWWWFSVWLWDVKQWSNSATQIFVCLPWVCC